MNDYNRWAPLCEPYFITLAMRYNVPYRCPLFTPEVERWCEQDQWDTVSQWFLDFLLGDWRRLMIMARGYIEKHDAE